MYLTVRTGSLSHVPNNIAQSYWIDEVAVAEMSQDLQVEENCEEEFPIALIHYCQRTCTELSHLSFRESVCIKLAIHVSR